MRAAAVAAVLIALLFVGNALGADSPKEEEVPRCHNARATIVGTDGPDKLRGTPGRDVILGLGGDDEIVGSLGNDIICGGPGADLIHGGRGNDIVDGGAGDFDRVIGDLGDDHVLGGPGNGDEAAGSLGIDTVSGGPGNMDLVHGDYGYDRMDGGAGSGDIASFATDVGAGKEGGVKVLAGRAHGARRRPRPPLPLREPRGLGFRRHPGRHQAGQHDRRRPRQGCPARRRRPRHPQRRTRAPTNARARRAARPPAALKSGRKPPPTSRSTRRPGAAVAWRSSAAAAPTTSSSPTTPTAEVFGITARKGIAIGPGCTRPGGAPDQVSCSLGGPARWLMADLGPGNDSLQVEGSLAAVGFVRLAGGLGNDTIKGGPEDDLIEAGFGADKLYGGAGSDGLIGSMPGPTYLYGGANGDLLAAGGGCAGGAIVGGPGRDDASFAETQAHPGLLWVSFPLHKAWIDAVKGCNPVRLDRSDEDMEGSFDNDVLIGDGGKNAILGQPGVDRIYGNGGEDVLDARDGVRDAAIQCAPGAQIVSGADLRPAPSGHAFVDSFDPHPVSCAETTIGHPVKGLGKSAEHHPSR